MFFLDVTGYIIKYVQSNLKIVFEKEK